MEPIRFKVTSRINVSRVKEKLGSILEVSEGRRDVAVVKTRDMRWEVIVMKNYVILVPLMPLNCRTYVNRCHAEDLGCFPLFLCVR